MKKLMMLLLCGALLLALAGCGGEQNVKKDGSIKIGGSSTLAGTIAKCAEDFTEKNQTWNKANAQLPDEQIMIFVASGGSGMGVNAPLNGSADIGMVSRTLKDSEREKLKEFKVHTLGYDALTIAVNPQNPLTKLKTSLTKDELKKIFAGEIKTWKELDPSLPDRPIVLAIRDLGGGASQVFDEAIMKGTPVAKQAIQLPSMGALAAKVQENADAIGYVSVGFVQQNRDKFGIMAVDGIAPSDENISAGQYPLARPLLLLVKEKADAKQQEFLKYVLSETGIQTLKNMGFVPAKK